MTTLSLVLGDNVRAHIKSVQVEYQIQDVPTALYSDFARLEAIYMEGKP